MKKLFTVLGSKVSDFILNIEGSRVHFGNSEKGVSTYFIFIDNFSAWKLLSYDRNDYKNK